MADQSLLGTADRAFVLDGSAGVVLSESAGSVSVQPMMNLPTSGPMPPMYGCIAFGRAFGGAIAVVDEQNALIHVYFRDPRTVHPISVQFQYRDLIPRSIAFINDQAFVLMRGPLFEEVLLRTSIRDTSSWNASSFSQLGINESVLLGATTLWPCGNSLLVVDSVLHAMHLMSPDGSILTRQDLTESDALGLDEDGHVLLHSQLPNDICRISRLVGDQLDRQPIWEGPRFYDKELRSIATWKRGELVALVEDQSGVAVRMSPPSWARLEIPWVALRVDVGLHRLEQELEIERDRTQIREG